MSDFDAWTATHDEPIDADAPPPQIDTTDVVRAERQLARLRRLAAERAEVDQVHRATVAKADAYKADRLAGIEHVEEWLTTQLESWHRARVDAGLIRGKSWTSVSGTLKLRAPGQPKLIVDDVDVEALQQTRPTWVREKLELDKQAIKATTEVGPDGQVIDVSTGEVVEGMRYEVSTVDTFSWEVS